MDTISNLSNLKHLAIIPDGNRRWAKIHSLFPWQGHVEGVKRFWEIADFASEIALEYLTFWAGSYSNLEKRSSKEVSVLFDLLERELSREDLRERLNKTQTRFRLIGEWREFTKNDGLSLAVESLEEETKNFTEHNLTILFGYDGQREMLDAARIMQGSSRSVDVETLQNSLWTKDLPSVDFVIRTGGEPHWSAGFLMWQTSNSQFYFTETLWPDFKVEQIKMALEDFQRRERRMGK